MNRTERRTMWRTERRTMWRTERRNMWRTERRAYWQKKANNLAQITLAELIIVILILLCVWGVLFGTPSSIGSRAFYQPQKVCVVVGLDTRIATRDDKEINNELEDGNRSTTSTEPKLYQAPCSELLSELPPEGVGGWVSYTDPKQIVYVDWFWEHENKKGDSSNINNQRDFDALGDNWKSSFTRVNYNIFLG